MTSVLLRSAGRWWLSGWGGVVYVCVCVSRCSVEGRLGRFLRFLRLVHTARCTDPHASTPTVPRLARLPRRRRIVTPLSNSGMDGRGLSPGGSNTRTRRSWQAQIGPRSDPHRVKHPARTPDGGAAPTHLLRRRAAVTRGKKGRQKGKKKLMSSYIPM